MASRNHHQHDHHDNGEANDGLAPNSYQSIYSPAFCSTLFTRDFNERSFTIGICGLLSTGKTALMLALCKLLRDKYSLAAVMNNIFTKEDGESLEKNGALPEERIRVVETGGCPLAAIREDISVNLGPLEELFNLYKTDILFCVSGGDNLAANFSRELADYIICIIDVSVGDKIIRKGGPCITQADLLVINKTDLAAAVGADLAVMERDALRMRDGGPFVFSQCYRQLEAATNPRGLGPLPHSPRTGKTFPMRGWRGHKGFLHPMGIEPDYIPRRLPPS